MSRKTIAPLTEADLSRYISDASDFAFEMATLSAVRALGFEGQHAGSYVDPVTGKIRAYDIRANWDDGTHVLRLANECKSLRASAPLLIQATPRLASESYHSVVFRYRIGDGLFHDVERRTGVYAVDVPVGRQPDQPTLDDAGTFRSSDGATFEKWMQAVNGCSDLVKQIVDAPLSTATGQVAAVVPILVVPERTLWQISYNADGSVDRRVHLVDHATLILRHKWSHPAGMSLVDYDVSHLELVTLPALQSRLRVLMGDSGIFAGSEALLAAKL